MINYGSDCRKDVIKLFLEFVVMVYVKMCLLICGVMAYVKMCLLICGVMVYVKMYLLIYGGICGSSCDPAWLTGHALKSGY